MMIETLLRSIWGFVKMSYGKSINFLLNQMRNYAGSLASGTITFYAPGTTTKKAVYLDREMTQQAANPYTLSADGTAELFGSGLYDVVFKAYGGAPVYNYSNVDVGGAITTSDFSQQETGDGTTVEFPLDNNNVVFVAISGIVQATDTYTIASSKITFSEAPPLNTVIDIRFLTV